MIPEDLALVKASLKKRVTENATREDPLWNAFLAALELEYWLEAAHEHLRLIDQTELKGRTARMIEEAHHRVYGARLQQNPKADHLNRLLDHMVEHNINLGRQRAP